MAASSRSRLKGREESSPLPSWIQSKPLMREEVSPLSPLAQKMLDKNWALFYQKFRLNFPHVPEEDVEMIIDFIAKANTVGRMREDE